MVKRKLLKTAKLAGLVILIVSLISCASTTTVQVHDESGSIDRDVKIYLDASYKGRGEVIHSDTKIISSTTTVTLRKEGYRTMQYSFSRSEKLLVEPLILIGGLFFWFPFS